MKLNPLHLLLGLSLSLTATAQTAPSGRIKYEVMQRVDLSQVRMVINGQEVRPGTALPGGGTVPDVPETRSYGQELIFAGNYAREKRDENGGMMNIERRVDGPGGPGNETRPPSRR